MRRRGLRGRPRFWGMVIFSQYELAHWAIDGNCLTPVVLQGWGLYSGKLNGLDDTRIRYRTALIGRGAVSMSEDGTRDTVS